MSMTLADAKTYVARILGGADDANLLLGAEDSIRRTIGKWSAVRDWNFLLQDNSETTPVAGCVIAGDGVGVTNATSGALFGVNVGQTVTGSGVPADTTVAAVTEASGLGVTTITLSQASTPATVTLTFGAYIPLRADTQTYNLPSTFGKPYTARLISNPRTLKYYRLREIDRKVANQDRGGTPSHYTIYNVHTFQVAAQHRHLRLYPTPSAADSLHLKFYRSMSLTATTVDIPDEYLYDLLDDARAHLLQRQSEDDPRLPLLLQEAKTGLARAIADDDEESEDEDIRFISQQEAGEQRYADFNIWDDNF